VKSTTFLLGKMDCSSEEQLVRMKLADVPSITAVVVDLTERTATVYHDADSARILRALDSLNLDTSTLSERTDVEPPSTQDRDRKERRVLVIALAINSALFFGEFTAGIVSGSMGLLADSLDNFADASVYALSLVAVGGTVARKKGLAATSGYLQLGLAAVGLVEVIRRAIGVEEVPNSRMMIVVSLIALAGNMTTLLILRRAHSSEAHFQASWIFTANDVLVNGLVILAAIAVIVTNNPAADLIAGALIFLIVANGARRILALSR
jgi:Co/Zn/Cd efflux system component